MYIEGPLKSGKTAWLTDKFIEIINSGASTSEILVICANKFKQHQFTEKIKENLSARHAGGFGNFPVYTFNGIVYNSILNNWPLVEEILSKIDGNTAIMPNLCGLETTEYILKQCIKEINKKQDISLSFRDYASDQNLIHQLLRRYRLITENLLEKDEINSKSDFLDESFSEQAKDALDRLKKKTLNLRCFDYLKQTNTFLYLLQNHNLPEFKNINYLFADDFDELSYSAQFFVKTIMPNVKEFFIAADPDGGTRRGYLCANPDGWHEIKEIIFADVQKLTCKKDIYEDADELFKAIKTNLQVDLNRIELISEIKRIEMIDAVIKKLGEILFEQKKSAGDIVIITPNLDEAARCEFIDFFDFHNIKYQFLSGSKKILDDIYVFGALITAQLINEDWQLKPTPFEIRILLTKLLGFPAIMCNKITEAYSKNYKKLDKNLVIEYSEFNDKYKNLLNSIKEIREKNLKLHDQLALIFTKIIMPELKEDSELQDFNSMLKSLQDFYFIVDKLEKKPANSEKEWIIQIKNTVVHDTPSSAPEIKEDSVKIATPQKVIDFELESKIQIWLDVSASMWTKDDTGPLYNSWVFQKNWQEENYSPEIHKKLTLEKTAHVLRKLVLCADEKIYCFASELDSAGNENNGILIQYLEKKSGKFVTKFEFTPREDQKPVLKYKGGKLAIPAVPGAGKTTIIQALAIELLKKGVKPSEILILTYMESAAENIREKIKNSVENLPELPVIRTIHGLAYKIIQDEDNFTKLGLSSDFELCDDTVRSRILEEICVKYLPAGEEKLSNWVKYNSEAISKAKLSDISYHQIDNQIKIENTQELSEFLPVYTQYVQRLKQLNMIDFDDLLMMGFKLLNDYPEIKNYYQNQFKYVIEDEAQDSSEIQQKLISLISEGSGNLVRCGDINQAIMNTFTNADVRGFRSFIEKNKKIEMTSSQRCAHEVYGLANHLIDWSLDQNHLKNSFFPIYMKAVEGKNPEIQDSLSFNIFENSEEEKRQVIDEILRLKEIDSDMGFGILLRTNPLVIQWARLLEEHNIPYICFTDNLGQKKVFKVLLKYLEVLLNPWNNKLVSQLYNELTLAKIYKKDFDSQDFLNKLGSPFVSFELTDLPTGNLAAFRMDIQYWLDLSAFSPEELILRLGFYYFPGILDRSNVQLFSILASRFKNRFTSHEENKSVNLPEIVNYFKELSYKNRIGGVKFFEEEALKSGFVQVMTVHKAKGLEFDAVFMPEMYEDEYSYCVSPENIKKTQKKLLAQLSGIADGKVQQNEFQAKIEQVEEHMRLIYVGITRAKKFLYMSSSSHNKRKSLPSKILEHFLSSKNLFTEGQKNE